MALLLAGALAPVAPSAEAATAGERLQDVVNVDIASPASTSNALYTPYYYCGQPCYTVLTGGGHIEYAFELITGVDFIEVTTAGWSGAGCTWTLSHWFGESSQYGWCPYSQSLARPVRFEGVFLDSYIGSAYRIKMFCHCYEYTGWDGTRYYPTASLAQMQIVTGYRALTLDPLASQSSVSVPDRRVGLDVPPKQCVTANVRGSFWYPVDYFRVSWGDGQETYEEVAYNTQGQWSREFCHSYPPKLGNYQVCVTVHDRLDRLVRECKDVSWGVDA